MRLLTSILLCFLGITFLTGFASGQTPTNVTSQDSLNIEGMNGGVRVLFSPPIKYPSSLLDLTKKAAVTVLVAVDTNGSVQGVVKILHSTDCEFDSLAIALAMQYKFAPMGFYGKKSRVLVTLPINFDASSVKETPNR